MALWFSKSWISQSLIYHVIPRLAQVVAQQLGVHLVINTCGFISRVVGCYFFQLSFFFYLSVVHYSLMEAQHYSFLLFKRCLAMRLMVHRISQKCLPRFATHFIRLFPDTSLKDWQGCLCECPRIISLKGNVQWFPEPFLIMPNLLVDLLCRLSFVVLGEKCLSSLQDMFIFSCWNRKKP